MEAVKTTAQRRILFFADASSVHTRRWVQSMVERSFECFVATRLPASIPGAADVIALAPGHGAAGWFSAIPQVRALARRIHPQWLHGHYVTSYGLWAAACDYPAPKLLTAWGSDILVTPRARGWRGRAMRALVGWSLRRASLITADSQDVLAEIRRYRVHARCEEVLWGVDIDRFAPGTVAAAGFEVVSLRNWEPNYNIDTLLRAWALFVAERPLREPVLHLLGGGPDEAALRRLTDELGIARSVRFTGRVGDTAMVATLQRARASVSVPSSDATSVSMLESMACALPVVVSDLPANRAWVDANSGLTVPARDEHALAQALVRLHDNPSWAAEHGARNRERVLQRASRRAQFDRMAELYDQLLAPHPERLATPAR